MTLALNVIDPYRQCRARGQSHSMSCLRHAGGRPITSSFDRPTTAGYPPSDRPGPVGRQVWPTSDMCGDVLCVFNCLFWFCGQPVKANCLSVTVMSIIVRSCCCGCENGWFLECSVEKIYWCWYCKTSEESNPVDVQYRGVQRCARRAEPTAHQRDMEGVREIVARCSVQVNFTLEWLIIVDSRPFVDPYLLVLLAILLDRLSNGCCLLTMVQLMQSATGSLEPDPARPMTATKSYIFEVF